MRVGFTGTQVGMTDDQKHALRWFLAKFEDGDTVFHHGLCVGADAEADAIARAVGLAIVGHPAATSKQMPWRREDFRHVAEVFPPLVRNHHIVERTRLLIVAPRQRREVLRSGTWATYRYAQKVGRPTLLLYPYDAIDHIQHLGEVHSGFRNELVLGFQRRDFPVLAGALGIDYDMDDGELVAASNAPMNAVERVQAKLAAAHEAACREMGWTIGQFADGHLVVETPLGIRALSPFSLSLMYEDEFGETPTDDTVTIGVSISSRYFPCFADWHDQSGTLWPVVFDADLMRMMDIAKRNIVAALPVFEKAVWIVRECFY